MLLQIVSCYYRNWENIFSWWYIFRFNFCMQSVARINGWINGDFTSVYSYFRAGKLVNLWCYNYQHYYLRIVNDVVYSSGTARSRYKVLRPFTLLHRLNVGRKLKFGTASRNAVLWSMDLPVNARIRNPVTACRKIAQYICFQNV